MFAKSETPEESRSVASTETVSIKYPSQTHPISLSPFKCFQITSLFRSFKDFIYFIFREGKWGEREGEKHQCVVASRVPSTGDLACNPGMCSDWEMNWRPFG